MKENIQDCYMVRFGGSIRYLFRDIVMDGRMALFDVEFHGQYDGGCPESYQYLECTKESKFKKVDKDKATELPNGD